MYSSINSWLEKFLKLKSNYNEEVKNIISEHNFSQKVTNHSVYNYSGKIMILYRIALNKEKEFLVKLNANCSYDISHFEEKIDRNIDTDENLTIKKNILAFDFENESISEHLDMNNTINIDNIEFKKFTIGQKKTDYLGAEVNLNKVNKSVSFYSPILFKNKTNHKFFFRITLSTTVKKGSDYFCNVDKNGIIGIPHEYLEGILFFVEPSTNKEYHTINLINGILDNNIIYFKEDIVVNRSLKVTISKKRHQVISSHFNIFIEFRLRQYFHHFILIHDY